jgi:type IV pilus assembly protein PilC
MFSAFIRLPDLFAWCRALRYGLHAGLSPVKILRMQGKSGPPRVRPLANTLADRLKAGESFEEALTPYKAKFPKLFLELVTVGEKAGKLTEVFEELEKYFQSQYDARKQFLAAITWPAVMYLAMVVIIALLVTILALLGGKIDPLGLAFLGVWAGLLVLVLGLGFGIGIALLYFLVRDNDNLKQKFEAFGLRIPGLTGAYRSFALHRFSMALGMTHEAGMRADTAVSASFRATANGAYMSHGEPSAKLVRGGKSIVHALTSVGTNFFPEEYLDSVQVGESSGQISEVMGRVSEQYREEGIRRTKTITAVVSFIIYGMVGILVIVMIVRIFMKAYLEPLNDALKMNGM